MKTNKKTSKVQKQQECKDEKQQDVSCCRYVSYCDCCGCYDYVVCC